MCRPPGSSPTESAEVLHCRDVATVPPYPLPFSLCIDAACPLPCAPPQAASHLAQLKTQRQQLLKGINHIASKDI